MAGMPVKWMMNVFILLLSLLIYSSYGLWGLGYLTAAIVLSWGAGILMTKHRWILWPALAALGGILVFYKLQPLTGLVLPGIVGLSYFSLQIVSYLLDIYREKYPPEQKLLHYACCVAYLPSLWMGPIERYDRISDQWDSRHMTASGFFDGGRRALWGAFKILVIGARLAVIISAIAKDPGRYYGSFALTAMVLYSVQLYADFSGAMDVVLGISQMLGLKLTENFDAPFLAQSVREFWQRWHISLGSWLRDYIYIPLGGNKKGSMRKVVNLMATFLVSGLWHGVHYLVWGALNGLLVACAEKWRTPIRWINRLGTFLVISLLWCFFIWQDTFTAIKMLASVFTTLNYGVLLGAISSMGLTLGDGIVLVCGIFLLVGYECFRGRLEPVVCNWTPAGKTAAMGALALVILIFGMYGLGFDADAFLYSRF